MGGARGAPPPQARAELQIELGTRTRTLHATEESRDTTWDAEPRFSIPARFTAQIDSGEELKRCAVVALVRSVERALRQTPPESVEPVDAAGCLAYGLALAVATGDRLAAVTGQGDAAKIEACEKILGMPRVRAFRCLRVHPSGAAESNGGRVIERPDGRNQDRRV